jgi:hypothetical protein
MLEFERLPSLSARPSPCGAETPQDGLFDSHSTNLPAVMGGQTEAAILSTEERNGVR